MVFDKVVELLKNYRDTDSEITRETGFADLGLDSLDRVELAMSLEKIALYAGQEAKFRPNYQPFLRLIYQLSGSGS